MMEGQRLLLLELAEANGRMEKARRGRKAAEKVQQGYGGSIESTPLILLLFGGDFG